MPRFYTRMAAAFAVAACVVAAAVPARADTVADFYKGRQMRIVVGAAAGSDYDLGSRLLAEYMTRYIPGNPTIVVQDMVGAGGIRAANYVYNAAPKDGTVIADFSRNIPSQAALGQKNVRVDPRRMGWIGATSLPNRICAVNGSNPIRSIDQLYTTPLLVGSTGVGSAYSILPTMINEMLGTKFKIVEGYKGLAAILLAMERGELGGVCQTLNQFRSTYVDKIKTGAVRILFNVEQQTVDWPPGTPTIFGRLKTESDRQLFRFVFDGTAVFGRPYAFGPDVPADRLAAVRKAFLAAMKDPAFLADAKRQRLDMRYRTAEELENDVKQIYATPPEVMKKAAKILVR